jgi:hypothetical protein
VPHFIACTQPSRPESARLTGPKMDDILAADAFSDSPVSRERMERVRCCAIGFATIPPASESCECRWPDTGCYCQGQGKEMTDEREDALGE